MTDRDIADAGLILRAVVGSTAHGLHVPGTDDHDEMGICVEPPERVIGLRPFEQYIYRSAEERRKHSPEADQRYTGRTPPSEPGDLDLVVYSLRKYVRLVTAGNPTVILLLFAQPTMDTVEGRKLRDNAHLFASKEAGLRFLGYLKAQRERLLGLRGQMRVTRTELIQKHGYDTKYAMHATRLGYQGIEYLSTGKLTLPMVGEGRDVCMATRRGEYELPEVIANIQALERELCQLTLGSDDFHGKLAAGWSPLPEHPDKDAIDRLLVELYSNAWRYIWQ